MLMLNSKIKFKDSLVQPKLNEIIKQYILINGSKPKNTCPSMFLKIYLITKAAFKTYLSFTQYM